jgi:hypothetical protein
MDVHPTKNVSIGIDPYPYPKRSQNGGLTSQTSDLRSRNFAVSAKMML